MRFFFPALLLLFPSLAAAQERLLTAAELQAEPIYFQLSQALKDPTKVYKLYADDLNTEPDSLWAALPLFVNLQQLSLEGEFFTTPPKNLLLLRPRLHLLSIKDNSQADWEALFRMLADFRFLHTLHLEDCDFAEQIPAKSLGDLRQILHLSLANSYLADLPPTLGKLKNLQTLDLRSTQLTALPEVVLSLPNLTALYAGISEEGFPNRISALPAKISRLKALQILQLDQNPLTRLPDDFVRLPALHTLHLRGCAQLDGSHTLKILSAMPNLSHLSLSELRLVALNSNSLKNWQQLEYLDLSYCSLNYISPDLARLPRLHTLSLKGNSDLKSETIELLREKIANLKL